MALRKYSAQINKRSVRGGQKARSKGEREREAMRKRLADQKDRARRRGMKHKAKARRKAPGAGDSMGSMRKNRGA